MFDLWFVEFWFVPNARIIQVNTYTGHRYIYAYYMHNLRMRLHIYDFCWTNILYTLLYSLSCIYVYKTCVRCLLWFRVRSKCINMSRRYMLIKWVNRIGNKLKSTAKGPWPVVLNLPLSFSIVANFITLFYQGLWFAGIDIRIVCVWYYAHSIYACHPYGGCMENVWWQWLKGL